MNKIVILFVSLFTVFCTAWVVKAKTPLNKQNDAAEKTSNSWWVTDDEIENVSYSVTDEYTLDPEIPENYIPVVGSDELYMVVDDNGKIVKYRQRTKNSDGVWEWKDVNPDIPDNYEAVDGIEDVYKVTDENGNVKYYKYIRNDDNTFSFVECDENGNIIDAYILAAEQEGAENNNIPKNYVQLNGNIYEVKDENGVTVGYKEKAEDKDGNLSWSKANPNKAQSNGNKVVTNKVTTTNIQMAPPTVTQAPTQQQSGGGNNYNPVTTTKKTSTHTQSESYTEVQTVGDYKITYQYTIVKTYNEDGELLSTEKEGPTVVGRELISNGNNTAPDTSLIESNIDNEIVRVTSKIDVKDDIASSVVNSLNAERSRQGVASLSSGGDAEKVAKIFAADMANYNFSDYNTVSYGTLEDILSRYNISNKAYGLNIWKTTSEDAAKIHSRFQAIDGCREARMSAQFNYIGEAVMYSNGYYYIAEVLLYV